MSKVECLVYPYAGEEFAIGNLVDSLQEDVDIYNANIKNEINEEKMWSAVYSLVMGAKGNEFPNEFSLVMAILLFALDTRQGSRSVWMMGMHTTYEQNDMEVCRELIFRAIESGAKSDVKNSTKEFIPLSKETKEENIADIFGMITEELEADGLEEDKYHQLLEDFAKLLVKWRELEVPKTCAEKSYEIISEIIETCCRHKAYHTAVRLSGLLFAADRTKKKEYLPTTMYLMGKVMYELNYMEVAKRCFYVCRRRYHGTVLESGR